MKNSFNRESTLYLKAVNRDGKTIIENMSFSAPFKIMRPFYLKKDVMTVMLLTASAGIMAGDRQLIDIVVERGATVEFISQAYEKIHRMEEGYASRKTNIYLEPEATLIYTPLPVIPFKDSDFRNRVRVDLADETSQLIMYEVLTSGRINFGESFEYEQYVNDISIYQNGELTYRDNTRYIPKMMPMTDFGFFEGFTHLGTLILCNTSRGKTWIKKARKLIETEDLKGGVTLTASHYIVVKLLANKAEKIEEIFNKLLELPE